MKVCIRDSSVPERPAGWNRTTALVIYLEYNAFGTITSQANFAHQPLQTYTGQIQDSATGLLCYDARWYDPRVAQFVNEGKIGFAAGSNKAEPRE